MSLMPLRSCSIATAFAVAALSPLAVVQAGAIAEDARLAAESAPEVNRLHGKIADDLEAQEIAPGVWRYVAWFDLPGYGRTPANGLIVVSGREALLVNTGWTNNQASRLGDWIERTSGARVTIVVPTHTHADTMGGLKELHRRSATSWAHERTDYSSALKA